MQRTQSNFASYCNERQIIYKGFVQFPAKIETDVEDHLIQISCDTRQLYLSIPVQDTLNITHLELVNDKTLKDRTKWKPKQIINLLETDIEETDFYDFQGNIWEQTDGLAIGKSISGALTDI